MSALLPVVTIDGPSGVGKSSLAKMLSRALDLPHLDTGAMFRAAALALGPAGTRMSPDELKKRLAALSFDLAGDGAAARLVCNGITPGNEIRNEEVGLLASTLAKRAEVRSFMQESERRIGSRHALIVDGRDTGEIIFPNAAFKFFLEGEPHVRALRRKKDLEKLGATADLRLLENEMRKRDEQDRNRLIAPLRPAKDATIIDTTSMSLNDVFDKALHEIQIREKSSGIKLNDSV